MPNIEIHGLPIMASYTKREEIFRHLRQQLPGLNVGEAVVTIIPSEVRDSNMSSRPYLRLACTDDAEAKKVAEALRPLGIDIELLKLQAFIPAMT